MTDPQKLKQVAVWAVPLFLGLAGLGIWVSVGDIIPTLDDILRREPSLRIRPYSLLMPLVAMFGLLGAVMFPLRILQADRTANAVQNAWLGLTIVILALIPIVWFAGGWLQQRYLPPLGYHLCDKLEGNPTVWFTDWVKNPEWCVYQKDHTWVRTRATEGGGGQVP